jgi:CRISPR system Cascade subunit CasA
MLHALVCRETLLQTITANLLSKATIQRNYRRPWGRPVWEIMPQSFSDKPAIENATGTYLGRLMPLARSILLHPACKTLVLANAP